MTRRWRRSASPSRRTRAGSFPSLREDGTARKSGGRLLNLRICAGLLVLLGLLVPTAGAISLSHGQFENPILYVPGKTYTFDFTVSNYRGDAGITAEGEWTDYVTFSDITSPAPGTKKFSITIAPPEEPDTPGTHWLYIGAAEILPPGTGVAALAAVRKSIGFKVLYPFKSLSASLNAPDVNVGETTHFQLAVKSETLQKLWMVRGSIEVMDGQGNVLGTVGTQRVGLNLGEQKMLTAGFDTSGLKPATYRARATVTYDGNETVVEDDFRVGTLAVEIINHTRELPVGAISPFLIEVRSGWNDPLEAVYGQVYINGTELVRTPTRSLAAWEQANLTGYFDTTGWTAGQVEATIIAFFGENSTIKVGDITLFERKESSVDWIRSLGWMHLLIAGIVVLICLLAVNILLLTSRKDRHDRKRKK